MPSDSTLKPGPGAHSPEKVSCYVIVTKQMNVLMRNKKPTRCYLVLYLFLLCKLLNMFRANLCPSSGAGDLVVFLPRGVVPWLCMLWVWPPTQPWHYTTRGKNCARYSPMDTQPANRIWPPTQPRHYTTRGKNTTKQSAPEDGHNLARNMLSKLQRRNKYNTKWHLVGFLFHIASCVV